MEDQEGFLSVDLTGDWHEDQAQRDQVIGLIKNQVFEPCTIQFSGLYSSTRHMGIFLVARDAFVPSSFLSTWGQGIPRDAGSSCRDLQSILSSWVCHTHSF